MWITFGSNIWDFNALSNSEMENVLICNNYICNLHKITVNILMTQQSYVNSVCWLVTYVIYFRK